MRIINLRDRKTIWTIILILLIVITLTFIFSESCKSVMESKERSKNVLKKIKPLIDKVVGEKNATDHLVRKIAHFVEFFLLGLEVAALCLLRGFSPVYGGTFGLLMALSDETIQIFSDRGAQVQDVWLDFSAVVAALLIVCGIDALHRRKKVRF